MVAPRVVERRVVVGGRGGVGCVVGSPCVSRCVSRRLLSVGRVSCGVAWRRAGWLSSCRAESVVWCPCRVLFGPVGRIVAGGCGVLSAGCPVSSCVSSCLSCWLRRVVLVVLVVLRLGERRVSRRVALGVGELQSWRPPPWSWFLRLQFSPAHL